MLHKPPLSYTGGRVKTLGYAIFSPARLMSSYVTRPVHLTAVQQVLAGGWVYYGYVCGETEEVSDIQTDSNINASTKTHI